MATRKKAARSKKPMPQAEAAKPLVHIRGVNRVDENRVRVAGLLAEAVLEIARGISSATVSIQNSSFTTNDRGAALLIDGND